MSSIYETMSAAAAALHKKSKIDADQAIKVGIDLGTAFTVVMVTDEKGFPIVSANRFADVVRDGIVWDFAGATNIVRELREEVENRINRSIVSAAVTIPPGVNTSDHRAHKYVLESAGIECSAVVDEPTAANAVLGLTAGAVVDIGGGTTGIAIVQDGQIVKTLDEPSGGTHLSLVIAGALGISFEEAEQRKRDYSQQKKLLPMVTPVMQKIGTIVRDGIKGYGVEKIVLVGGTCAFEGIARVVSEIVEVNCEVAPEPMFVTPLGVAHYSKPSLGG